MDTSDFRGVPANDTKRRKPPPLAEGRAIISGRSHWFEAAAVYLLAAMAPVIHRVVHYWLNRHRCWDEVQGSMQDMCAEPYPWFYWVLGILFSVSLIAIFYCNKTD